MVCFCFFLSLRASSPIYGEQSEPGENARARAEAPRTGDLARRLFFSLPLCYCTSWGRRFSSSFLALEASQRWNEKTSRRAWKSNIVCQGRKPFKSRNTRLHRQTSLFFVIGNANVIHGSYKCLYLSTENLIDRDVQKLENTFLRTFGHWIKVGRLMIEVLFAMSVVNWQSFTSGTVVTSRCRASTVFIRLSALCESRRLFEAGRLLQLSAMTTLCSNKTWRCSKAVCLRKLCLRESPFFVIKEPSPLPSPCQWGPFFGRGWTFIRGWALINFSYQ